MAYNNYGDDDQGGGYGNNYSTTSYGAQGGADGGGFFHGGSQDGAKKTRGQNTLRPITVRQVHLAEEIHSGGEVTLDGAELTNVSLVAQVRNITKLSTNHIYKFDDGTGTIEGRVWTDIDAPTHDEFGNALAENANAPQTGDWVRVFGMIKFLGDNRFISVNDMKKVKDKNEINYHLLEATYVHLFITKGAPEAAQDSGNAGGAMQGVQSGYAQPTNGASDNLGNVSGVARKVYQRLQADTGNEGVHLDMVVRELGLPYAQVKKAAEELHNASKIFTTVDDDTYAVLEE